MTVMGEVNFTSRFKEYSDQLLNFQSTNYDELITIFFSILSDGLGFHHLFYSDNVHLYELNEGKFIRLPWQETQSLVQDAIKVPLLRYKDYNCILWLVRPPEMETAEHLNRLKSIFVLKLKVQFLSEAAGDVPEEITMEHTPFLNSGNSVPENHSIISGEQDELRMLREWNRNLEMNNRFLTLFLEHLVQDEIGALSIVIGLHSIIKDLPEEDTSHRSYFQSAMLQQLKSQKNFLELIDLSQHLTPEMINAQPDEFDLTNTIHESINRFIEMTSQQDVSITLENKPVGILMKGNAYLLIKYLSVMYLFNRLLSDMDSSEDPLKLRLHIEYQKEQLIISVSHQPEFFSQELRELTRPVNELMETMSTEHSNILVHNYCLHKAAALLKGNFQILADEKKGELQCRLTLPKQ